MKCNIHLYNYKKSIIRAFVGIEDNKPKVIFTHVERDGHGYFYIPQTIKEAELKKNGRYIDFMFIDKRGYRTIYEAIDRDINRINNKPLDKGYRKHEQIVNKLLELDDLVGAVQYVNMLHGLPKWRPYVLETLKKYL